MCIVNLSNIVRSAIRTTTLQNTTVEVIVGKIKTQITTSSDYNKILKASHNVYMLRFALLHFLTKIQIPLTPVSLYIALDFFSAFGKWPETNHEFRMHLLSLQMDLARTRCPPGDQHDDDKTCVICQHHVNAASHRVVVLPCCRLQIHGDGRVCTNSTHPYNGGIWKWLQSSGACPICRAPVAAMIDT